MVIYFYDKEKEKVVHTWGSGLIADFTKINIPKIGEKIIVNFNLTSDKNSKIDNKIYKIEDVLYAESWRVFVFIKELKQEQDLSSLFSKILKEAYR